MLMPGARSKRCRQARPLTGWVDSARARATGGRLRSSMQNPGRSRRAALTHPCQGRHRPRPWLAEMQEWTCNTLHMWWSEAIPVQAARRDNKATSFSSSMSVNRTGPFQGIRLSRRSALSIGASCTLRCSFRSLSDSPWTPSPCTRHYPDRLSSMGPLSP